MEKKDIKEILEKVSSGHHNDEEERIARLWLFRLHQDDEVNLSESQLSTSKQKVWDSLQVYSKPNGIRVARLWPRIVAVAAAVVLIVFGVYFYKSNTADKPAEQNAYVNDIAPGKVGATLTLANGQKINLTDAANGELVEESGISVSKTADGQLVYTAKEGSSEKYKINTLTTANGETYILTLPDRSKVWVNAASSLTYATALDGRGERRVKLSGEAYFQIAKDKAHPFIVESRGQQIEVLGTHFNVSSYADEANVKTTLEEGSVKVTPIGNPAIDAGSVKILIPGQQSLVGPEGVTVKQADLETDLAWKNGDFVFDHEDFESIIRKVEKWYDVAFIYEKGKYSHLILSGSVSRSNPLSVVLVSLQKAGKLKFKIEGRRVTIM